jgi:hypothetical protein
MKDHKELYGSYKKGTLDDAGIAELNRLLIEVYFSEKDRLDQEEQEYTGDLIFELYAKQELKEEYARKFEKLIDRDKALNKRFNILKSLVNPDKAGRASRRRLAVESEKADEQEEEELRSVLQEVLEKAHAEEEATTSQEWMDNLVASLKSFFQKLLLPFVILQPQDDRQLAPVYVVKRRVKMALVLVSLSGIFAYATWYTFMKIPEVTTADNVKTGIKNSPQFQAIDTSKIQKENDKIEVMEQESLLHDQMAQNSRQPVRKATGESENLLASIYAPPEFEYNLSRGEISEATKLFILAADKYNGEYVTKDYDSCISILCNLLDQNAFKDKDTINEMHYFLGHCYLAKGIKQSSDSLLREALQSFGSIERQDKYYKDATRYSKFIYAALGQPEGYLEIREIPTRLDYMTMGELQAMEDTIAAIMLSRPVLTISQDYKDDGKMTHKDKRQLFDNYLFINLNIGAMLQSTDIIINRNISPLTDWRLGYGGEFGWQFHPICGIRAGITIGELFGESKKDVYWMSGDIFGAPGLDSAYSNGVFFRAKLFEYRADLTINFSNLISGYNPGRFLDIYGIAGFGITEWTSTGYYFAEDGSAVLRYEDGKDVRGADGLATPNYKGYHKGFINGWNRKTDINWGLGFAFHIVPKFEANIEFQIKNLTGGKGTYIDSQGKENPYHQGDFLDNMENGSAAIYNDFYSYISLGLTYKFRK